MLKRNIYYFILFFFGIGSNQSIAQKVTEPEMVFVDGGTFRMGSENGDSDEIPVISVNVNSFYISKKEVTVAEYKLFCKLTGRQMPEAPVWGWSDDLPMVNVSWSDAGAYTLWLSAQTQKKYRLPLEKEWEFAARGGKTTNLLYSGSNIADDVAWYYETTYCSAPQKVGQMSANGLGLYDMSGNVWEWCKDMYSTQYFDGSSANAKNLISENYRVIRGGAWNSTAYHCRITNRDRNIPASVSENIGFRVARSE